LLRRSGVTVTIVVCISALALAGSPQLHELFQHNSAWPAHSCAITLPKAGKCVKVIESPGRPLVRRTPTIVLLPTLGALPGPVWIPKLFLEACRFEHAPPVLC
jgi:hypothetical protein